jgi:glycerol-3-phosphate cytidylyltransferase-like family protein
MALVAALKCVDEVFLEESMGKKGEYIKKFRANLLVMGDDWAGRMDEWKPLCEVLYLPRTPDICTTDRLAWLRSGINDASTRC